MASIWISAQVLAFRDCFVVIAWAFAGLVLTIPFIPKGRTPRKTRKIEPAQAHIG